jgi:hypothetical protein
MQKKVAMARFKVLSCYLSGGTEEKHKNLMQDSVPFLQDVGTYLLNRQHCGLPICSRHSRTNTTVLCCRYTDTRRQLLAPRRAAERQPVMQTWRTHAGSCWPLEGPLNTNWWWILEGPVARGSTWVTLSSSLWVVLVTGLRHNRRGRLEAPVAWGSTWVTLMSSSW